MLKKAGVDGKALATWNGYLSAEAKLKQSFGESTVQGVHLLNASHAQDLWYPYLWMLGGEIFEPREGHPTKDVYWFPAFNSTQGDRALEFLQQQVQAGIKPQTVQAEKEFVNRNFAVMLAGSWMPGEFPVEVQAYPGATSWIYSNVSDTQSDYTHHHFDGWMGACRADHF